MKQYIRKYRHAFSLVEMLMALLVASLLMAALAPVITRHTKEADINVSNSLRADTMPACAYVNNTTADMVLENDCIVPRDKHVMSAIIVSGGGGGGGAIGKTYDGTGDKNIAYNLTDNTTTITDVYGEVGKNVSKSFTIDSTMSDIWIELLSGGGAGGDGNASGGYPSSQSDCGDWGVYIAPEYNGVDGHGTCVSRFNPGEGRAGSPDIPSTVTQYQTGNTAGAGDVQCTSSANCCWYGNNNSSYLPTGGSTCTPTAGGYSGCYRTVCQWNAASKVCANWNPLSGTTGADKGRLPMTVEFVGWGKNSDAVFKNGSADGLQLCTSAEYNSKGVCGHVSGRCYGARHGSSSQYCMPNNMWFADERTTSDGSAGANNGYCSSTGFAVLSYAQLVTAGLSVRCVVDNISKFNAYRGGGGAGGPFLKIKIPDEVLKRAFTNDDGTQYTDTLRLTLIAGKGGDKNGTGDRATVGGTSKATLYKNGKIIWTVQTTTHTPGDYVSIANAKPTSHGSGVGQPYGYCNYANYLYEEPDKKKFENCSAHSCGSYTCRDELGVVYATSGQSGADGGNGGTPPAGWGGIRAVTNVRTTGGTASNIDGQDATSPGSGGSGGYCTQGPTKDTPICGKGGNGAGGAARFTYKKTYPGAGGGGGGAGKVLHIKNIPVTPGTKIKVQVGAQGSGGQAEGKGLPGGNSYIELPNGTKYEVTGGGAGQAATKAIISGTSITNAKGGDGGGAGTITNQSGITAEYMHYPNTNDDINLAKGEKAPDASSDVPYISTGGNGGINTKISALAGLHGIPCGAYSKTKITINKKDYQCGSSDLPTKTFDPVPLTRTLIASDIELNIGNYINTYAAGATGGAGGGWSINSFNGTENIGKGSNGMGGYVILYFQ